MGIALWAQPFGGKLNPNLQWRLLSQGAFTRLMRGGAALRAVKIRRIGNHEIKIFTPQRGWRGCDISCDNCQFATVMLRVLGSQDRGIRLNFNSGYFQAWDTGRQTQAGHANTAAKF